MAKVKVLSILQPFAQLVVMDVKQIETRTWSTNHRGELYIHASYSFHRGLRRMVSLRPFRDYIKLSHSELPLGQIIGKVNLVDVKTTEAIRASGLDEVEGAFGDYGTGRYGWIFKNAVMLKNPIPAKGALGLWNFDLPEMEVAHG